MLLNTVPTWTPWEANDAVTPAWLAHSSATSSLMLLRLWQLRAEALNRVIESCMRAAVAVIVATVVALILYQIKQQVLLGDQVITTQLTVYVICVYLLVNINRQ